MFCRREPIFKKKTINILTLKGFKSLPRTLIFLIYIYRCNFANLWYFKLRLFDLIEFIVIKYLRSKIRSTIMVCNYKGIRKAEFAAKNQLLCLWNLILCVFSTCRIVECGTILQSEWWKSRFHLHLYNPFVYTGV